MDGVRLLFLLLYFFRLSKDAVNYDRSYPTDKTIEQSNNRIQQHIKAESHVSLPRKQAKEDNNLDAMVML